MESGVIVSIKLSRCLGYYNELTSGSYVQKVPNEIFDIFHNHSRGK